jgi:ribonuclease HI
VTAPVDDRILPRGVVAGADAPVQVHFDGACQPPRGGGVATFGYTIEGVGLNHEDCGLATRPFSERATNNVAEYVGAIRALEWLHHRGYRGAVLLIGDSELVIRHMTGEYRVRAEPLVPYHQRLRELVAEFSSVEFRSVPREENGEADRLPKEAVERVVRRERGERA